MYINLIQIYLLNGLDNIPLIYSYLHFIILFLDSFSYTHKKKTFDHSFIELELWQERDNN